MTEDAEGSARQVLAELEERLATHELDQMADFFTADVVLIGDGEENSIGTRRSPISASWRT